MPGTAQSPVLLAGCTPRVDGEFVGHGDEDPRSDPGAGPGNGQAGVRGGMVTAGPSDEQPQRVLMVRRGPGCARRRWRHIGLESVPEMAATIMIVEDEP